MTTSNPAFEFIQNNSELRCDFALCLLLSERPSLITLFWPEASSAGQSVSEIRLGATRKSLLESGPNTRETDIEVVLQGPAGRWLLLIENKVDARAQPLQAEDYVAYANHQKATGAYDETRAVLFAPSQYSNSSFKLLDAHVTYEAVIDRVSSLRVQSARVCRALLQQCVQIAVAATDETMTEFYRSYVTQLSDRYPALRLVEADSRTAGQTNFEYQAKHLPDGYKLIHVSGSGRDQGWIKLQRYLPTIEAIEGAQRTFDGFRKPADIQFKAEKKSFQIYRYLPALDVRKSLDDQQQELEECLVRISEFVDWTANQLLP